MKLIVQQLLTLQTLQLASKGTAATSNKEILSLRAYIPPAMLEKFDRAHARGRKSVAIVRNCVCAECHIQVSSGVLAALVKGDVVQLCGNCGRYLCLPTESAASVPAPVAAPAAKKSRRAPRVIRSTAHV